MATHTLRGFSFGVVLLVGGCAAPFEPVPLEQVPFLDRAQTQSEDNVRVTAAVLSADETERVFDLDLYARGIQPVWLEIENNDESTMRFLPVGLDPEYFAPLEVSYAYRIKFAKEANDQTDRYFQDLSMPNRVGSGETKSGFVFSHLEHGTKIFNVDVAGMDHEMRSFTFAIAVPGLAADITDIDWADLYEPNEVANYDRHGVKEALELLPCCVINQDGSQQGLPINVVIVGTLEDMSYALVRGGWDATERTTSQQTQSVAIAGTDDRYRPVSIRYAFGRAQDASFRKSRHSGEPHSHLRLWLSPLTVNDVPVWIGEVGRDIATRSRSSDRLVDADDARAMLFQDILQAQALSFFGGVKRGDAAPTVQSYRQLGGAPFFADGFRMVLGIGSEPVAMPDAEHLRWEKLPF